MLVSVCNIYMCHGEVSLRDTIHYMYLFIHPGTTRDARRKTALLQTSCAHSDFSDLLEQWHLHCVEATKSVVRIPGPTSILLRK